MNLIIVSDAYRRWRVLMQVVGKQYHATILYNYITVVFSEVRGHHFDARRVLNLYLREEYLTPVEHKSVVAVEYLDAYTRVVCCVIEHTSYDRTVRVVR